MKRRAQDMEADQEEEKAPMTAPDPWHEAAMIRLRNVRRGASPMRANIGSPPAARQPRGNGVPVNSYAGQMGTAQPWFTPSSVDPRSFRLPYTLVTEKDVTVRKFTGSEEDHEPFIRWVDGIKKYIENKVTHQGEVDRILRALEWAEVQADVIGKEKMRAYLKSSGVEGTRLDVQLKELLLVQTEGRAHALVDRSFGGLDAWWRLKDRFLIRDAQKVSLRYQEFHNMKAVSRISEVPNFLDEIDDKAMKIEEAEGGNYRMEDHHKLGKLKTCC